MKNTKIITVSLAAALAIGAITANGVLVSADAEKGTIKVAASATPHAEILEEAKPILEKEGWDLEVTVFDDYVQPNLVVESGDFDANYFQHIPYLDNFNEEQGTHLVNAGGIHYEPFGIYPGTKKSLDELEDGDTIAVPNDTTNEARALLLLQDNGVITLKDGAGLEATVKDIEENLIINERQRDAILKQLDFLSGPSNESDVYTNIITQSKSFTISSDELGCIKKGLEAALEFRTKHIVDNSLTKEEKWKKHCLDTNIYDAWLTINAIQNKG